MAVTSALILAAGLSSRMGSIKALLPWQGKSLICHQADTLLEAGFIDVITVLGYHASEIKKEIEHLPVRVVINKNYAEGKCSSILAGILNLDPLSSFVLLTTADQPLTQKIVLQLICCHSMNPSSILVPSYQGKRGHPLLVPKQYYTELLQINEQTQGLKRFLTIQEKHVKTIEIDDPAILLNLNDRADYQAAHREDS